MRYMSVAILLTLIAIPCGSLAQNLTDAINTPASEAQTAPISELTVVGKNKGTEAIDFRYEMGDILQVKATGKQAQKLQNASKVELYFDGVRMTDLTSTPIEVEPEKGILFLNFHLVRNSTTDEDRMAWDKFFRSKDDYQMTVQPAVSGGNDLPVVVQSAYPVRFFVAESHYIWGTLIASLTILFVSYYWIVKHTKMLRDAGTNYYSLGKSQMAFWGLLVLLAFIGVWLLNGTMEYIPAQALVLLGISAATGLGAVVIGNAKISAIQTEIDELRKKASLIESEKANAPTSFSQESQIRLTEINYKIGDLEEQIKPGISNGFWKDICDDGNGISFHRMQVVCWTVVLGVVFIRYVAEVMSMPEFPETLLTLMGISNATYLGFKIPEK